MATNPNNSIGTNAAFGGRTSVNAFNDSLAVYSGKGILSGFYISPNSGMTVSIGGSGLVRDVAVAEDNVGNRTTINNISGSPITVTIPEAPASDSRYDTIVAYVVANPTGSRFIADNYGVCGLIVVSGEASSAPVLATDTQIRSAITTDSGTSGEKAYYVELGEVLVASETATITADMITQNTTSILSGEKIIDGTLNGSAITDGTINSDKIEDDTIDTAKIADSSISSAKIDWASMDVVHSFATASSADADTDLCSVVIPTTGVYLLSGFCRGVLQGTNDVYVAAHLVKNGVTFGSMFFNVLDISGVCRIAQNVSRIANLNAGDVIALRCSIALSAVTTESTYVAAIRIK